MDASTVRALTGGFGRPRGIFDLSAKEARVALLHALTQEPGFWDDSRGAQKILREADGLASEIALWRALLGPRPTSSRRLVELVEESGDAELAAELDRTAAALGATSNASGPQLLFSGEYDERPGGS